MRILQTAPIINNSNSINKEKNYMPLYSNVSFSGTSFGKSKVFVPVKKIFAPLTRQYNRFTSRLAVGFGKILNNEKVANYITKISKNTHLQDYLVSHLLTIGSIILSGLYINKTLHNDKLDPDKKRTLAINQASVWGVSTIMGYTFNILVDKKMKLIGDKFRAVNEQKPEHANLINKYLDGIKIAKTIMIFDIVYRYLAPVVVTPLANYIGNKLQEKKEAELANRIRKND